MTPQRHRRGTASRDAVDAAVLAIRGVATLKASWSLWQSLVEGDPGDAAGLLLSVLPLDALDRTRLALWGSQWGEDNWRHEAAVIPLSLRRGRGHDRV